MISFEYSFANIQVSPWWPENVDIMKLCEVINDGYGDSRFHYLKFNTKQQSTINFIFLRFFVSLYFWIKEEHICRVLSPTGLFKNKNMIMIYNRQCAQKTFTFHFYFLSPKKKKRKKEKSDKLWQVSGGLFAHLPPQNTLPAKWPPKPPFWLQYWLSWGKSPKAPPCCCCGKYTAARAGSLEMRGWRGVRGGRRGRARVVTRTTKAGFLNWETNLGIVMMKKTLTRTSKAGFLNWESICFDVSRAYCCWVFCDVFL